MKIVITGAIGHIGSYVIRDIALQFPNAEIVMVDNMMTQRFPSLFNLSAFHNYHFIEGDITKMDLNLVFKNADVVIHLAAITDAAGTHDKAEELEENNYKSTEKVASACLETGASLIALSSTSVYGTQKDVVDEIGVDSLKVVNDMSDKITPMDISEDTDSGTNEIVVVNRTNVVKQSMVNNSGGGVIPVPIPIAVGGQNDFISYIKSIS